MFHLYLPLVKLPIRPPLIRRIRFHVRQVQLQLERLLLRPIHVGLRVRHPGLDAIHAGVSPSVPRPRANTSLFPKHLLPTDISPACRRQDRSKPTPFPLVQPNPGFPRIYSRSPKRTSTPVFPNSYSQRSFRPKQADAFSPRSSANESACAAEKSLFAPARQPTPLIHTSFQNFLRHSFTTLRETFQQLFTVHTSFECHDRSNRRHRSNDTHVRTKSVSRETKFSLDE